MLGFSAISAFPIGSLGESSLIVTRKIPIEILSEKSSPVTLKWVLSSRDNSWVLSLNAGKWVLKSRGQQWALSPQVAKWILNPNNTQWTIK